MDIFFIIFCCIIFSDLPKNGNEELITYKHELKISYVQMLIKGCCWWHELQYIFVARGEFWACYQKRKTLSYGWKQAQTLTTNVITEAIVPVYLIFFVDCCDFQPASEVTKQFFMLI